MRVVVDSHERSQLLVAAVPTRSQGVTEIEKIPGRGHALTIDSGWREVADKALAFVRRFVKSMEPRAATSWMTMYSCAESWATPALSADDCGDVTRKIWRSTMSISSSNLG
jgi:hypothetical protein